MLTGYFIPVLLVSLQHVAAKLSFSDSASTSATNIEEVCDIVTAHNLTCVVHTVTTEDGYLLQVVNIRRDKQAQDKIALMIHGFLDSAMTWVIRELDSPAFFLAEKGYDVWLANTRGNMYSRAHVEKSPEDKDFWDFSFHEMAIFDVPAMINYILKLTRQSKLQVVAHSQGTSLIYVMASLKPDIASKIKNVICLAPVAYLHHAQKPFFQLVSLVGGPLLSGAVGVLGHGEFLNSYSALAKLFQLACTSQLIGYPTCGLGLASALFGPDPEQFEPEFASKVWKYYPAGSSTKNFIHLAQIVLSKKFRQYDYGLGNLAKYNSTEPPVYDLSKVSVCISLFAGKNDRLSALEDVYLLYKQLGNAVKYIIRYKYWNHIDHVWGKYMRRYLFGPMLEALTEYQCRCCNVHKNNGTF